MKFLNSDIIQSEIKQINELQQKLYNKMFKFYRMDKQDKLEHIDLLKKLIEKQKIMYTRIKLSDDPDVNIIKKNIQDSISKMGFSKDIDMNVVFNDMQEMMEKMEIQIRNE